MTFGASLSEFDRCPGWRPSFLPGAVTASVPPGPVVGVNRSGSWTRWLLVQLPVIWNSAERSPTLRIKNRRLIVARPGHSDLALRMIGAASLGPSVWLTCPLRATVTEGGMQPVAVRAIETKTLQKRSFEVESTWCGMEFFKLLAVSRAAGVTGSSLRAVSLRKCQPRRSHDNTSARGGANATPLFPSIVRIGRVPILAPVSRSTAIGTILFPVSAST